MSAGVINTPCVLSFNPHRDCEVAAPVMPTLQTRDVRVRATKWGSALAHETPKPRLSTSFMFSMDCSLVHAGGLPSNADKFASSFSLPVTKDVSLKAAVCAHLLKPSLCS